MHTALIMADVIAADPDASAALAQLLEAGITPVVLASSNTGSSEAIVSTVADLRVVSPAEDPELDDHDGSARLLAAARAGIDLPGSHFLSSDPVSARRAAEAGCRPIIVLGERSLDETLGPGEPEAKHAGVAPDLTTASRYIREEAEQLDALGAFPHGPHHVLTEGGGSIPSGRDLFTLFGLITLAGTAVALGIAYFLREIYETVTLPSIAWYVTLQFFPEWVRGLLFIAAGIGIGVAATRVISADRRRFG